MIDLLVLPTGPRQRSTEELDRTRLDSCFKVRPAPSRADEIDDWSKTKKSSTENGFESSRRERGPGGSFFDSQSRADESDSWVANKPFGPPRRSGSFEKRGSFASAKSKTLHTTTPSLLHHPTATPPPSLFSPRCPHRRHRHCSPPFRRGGSYFG
ncbi:hypothetical protein Tsubulata_009623 [Turnera subulata]|uniref:Uncharacterized protein n=1 Tax=Turnera subulata TaxID=218843 RepID=A0A9Q0F128_9ROSI|nr:hypothetical protein Tsubulata_009623 [Turnera subulata]